MRARVCLWHSGGECLPPLTKHLRCVLATAATMKPTSDASLRLFDGVSAEADSRCVLIFASGTRVESACRPQQSTCNVFLQLQPP